MADDLQIKMEGVEELLGRFKEVKHDVRYRGGRFALRKAAQVIRDAAKENALRLDDPLTAENISLNIVERWSGRRFRRTGDLMFRVGVLGGARSRTKDAHRAARRRPAGVKSLSELGEVEGKGRGNPGGDTFYWRFLEFGTQKAPAKPFLRPAMQKNVREATDTFVREYGKSIDRAIRRAKKQRAT